MSQASIIINVSDQEQVHSNGLSGTIHVPGKGPKEDFAMLVVYPRAEIQDIGDGRNTVHWLKAQPLAKNVVGIGTDAGTKEKWGVLLCEAEPDLTKEMLSAVEAEIEFLNDNMPDVKTRIDKKSGAVGLVNIEPDDVKKKKIELSDAVQSARQKFEDYCRKLVTKAEIAQAKANMLREDQRMVSQGDMLWATQKEMEIKNIGEHHRKACGRLGVERPWAYVPQELEPCPGCGKQIAKNILTCPACMGWLEEGTEELRSMPPKQRARSMYPERYDKEPVEVGAKK